MIMSKDEREHRNKGLHMGALLFSLFSFPFTLFTRLEKDSKLYDYTGNKTEAQNPLC